MNLDDERDANGYPRGARMPQQIIEEHHHHHAAANGNGNGSFGKLKDALLLAAILGLVGVVWNMSNNLTELRTTVTYLAQQIAELKAKVQ